MNNEKNNLKLLMNKKVLWNLNNIEDTLQQIYDHFNDILSRNEFLEKENKRLKSENYKDEELIRMKEQYDKMKEDYYRGFPITIEQKNKINEWKLSKGFKSNNTYHYEFYPTAIGLSGIIINDNTNDKFQFQEIS